MLILKTMLGLISCSMAAVKYQTFVLHHTMHTALINYMTQSLTSLMDSAAPWMSSGQVPFTQNTPPVKWVWNLLMKSITGSFGLSPCDPCRSCVQITPSITGKSSIIKFKQSLKVWLMQLTLPNQKHAQTNYGSNYIATPCN